MMKVLVTGDKGYIGQVLVPLLLSKGYGVVGLDTNYFGKGDEIFHPNYRSITKDIREVELGDLSGIDSIIHLSALSNDPMGEIDPRLTSDINYEASVRLAQFAKKAGVKRFLFSSSCSIYGIAKEDTVSEKSPVNPLTAYAKSKIDTEKELQKLSDDNFCVGLMRNSTVYGYSPKFRNDLVVNNLVTTALAYGEIRVMSDGTPWRPLIDVRDLSEIFIEFLKVDSEKINGRIINVGFTENNLRIRDIADVVRKHIPGVKIIYTGEHGKDTRSYKVSFDSFKSIFPHVKQEWTLDKSVEDMIKSLKQSGFEKANFESGEYTRLSVLKKLLSSKSVDSNLNWNQE